MWTVTVKLLDKLETMDHLVFLKSKFQVHDLDPELELCFLKMLLRSRSRSSRISSVLTCSILPQIHSCKGMQNGAFCMQHPPYNKLVIDRSRGMSRCEGATVFSSFIHFVLAKIKRKKSLSTLVVSVLLNCR